MSLRSPGCSRKARTSCRFPARPKSRASRAASRLRACGSTRKISRRLLRSARASATDFNRGCTNMQKKKNTPPHRPLSFDDVREIALSMPEVEEVTAYGMPAFKAGKTRFVGQPVPRPDVQPNSIGVPMTFEERARLLASRPAVYYLTDHFAQYPGVLVRLASVDRKELREIL